MEAERVHDKFLEGVSNVLRYLSLRLQILLASLEQPNLFDEEFFAKLLHLICGGDDLGEVAP